jgi:hypothetical protein
MRTSLADAVHVHENGVFTQSFYKIIEQSPGFASSNFLSITDKDRTHILDPLGTLSEIGNTVKLKRKFAGVSQST